MRNRIVEMDEKVLSLIVAYKPDTNIVENIKAISTQVNEVLIVNNGNNDELELYSEEFNKIKNLTLINNNRNLGIAYALNLGVEYANQKSYKWLLTFDQDSKVTANYVNNMIAAYNKYPMKKKLILLGPKHVNQSTYDEEQTINNAQDFLIEEIKTTMTSGNLINLKLLEESKVKFNEEFFIDYVDHDFCFQLRKRGYKIIEVKNAILLHNLGDITFHNVLLKVMKTTNHNFIRRYYITRNRFLVYKEHIRNEKVWIMQDIKEFFIELMKIILFERQKFRKIKSIFWGIKDALINKTGIYKYD